MKEVIYLLFKLLTTLAKLLRPGGSRTVIAENLLLKQQLIIHSRSSPRAPNLTAPDRILLGFLSLFMAPRQILRTAVIIKPSILLSYHNALKKRKYRLLYSPGGNRKPMSHPFVERLIGSVRRELLDQTFFWTATNLANKLRTYKAYYNVYRCHSGRDGAPPVASARGNVFDIHDYRWKKHCRGLFQLPVAA